VKKFIHFISPQQHRLFHALIVWVASFAISSVTGGTLYSSIFSAFLISALYLFCIFITYPFSKSIIHFPIFVTTFYLVSLIYKWILFDERMINQRVNGIDIVVNGDLLLPKVALLYAPLLAYGILIYQIPILATAAQKLWGKDGNV